MDTISKMNSEPFIYDGFYVHYKNMLYRILNIAFDNNDFDKKLNPQGILVIYQPQYNSSEFGKNVLWARPISMFFEDVNIKGQFIPRFRYVGKTAEEVQKELKNRRITINPKPIYKENILDSQIDDKISELDFENVMIRGFARHSENPEDLQVIYNKKTPEKTISLLSIVSAKKFFQTYNLNPEEPPILKYLKNAENKK